MAISRSQKEAQVKDLQQKFDSAESVIFTKYIGLSVSDVSELREKLRENKAEMKVAKKTLMRLATKGKNVELSEDDIEGPIACLFSYEDPIAGAQTAFKFAKDHPQVELMGGVFDGKMLTKEQAMEFAKLPSRLSLLATFMSMIQSPVSQFASACSSPLSGFAIALKEVAKQKESTPAA